MRTSPPCLYEFVGTDGLRPGERFAFFNDNKRRLNEVVVTKTMDTASPQLLLEWVAGKLDNKVILKFTTTTNKTVETFLSYQLDNCGISNYTLVSNGDMPNETLSLNFTKITETFIGMDPTTNGTPETVGYDLTQMQKA